jgi:hypothetical protein
MPDFTLNRVTEYAPVPGSSELKLVAERHYIRLRGSADDPPLYIQQGCVFGEGGDPIAVADLPAWFWEELAKCAPASLLAAGWQQPLEPPAVDAEAGGSGRARR